METALSLNATLPTITDFLHLNLIIMLFSFLNYVSLRRFLASKKLLWDLQKNVVLMPFFEKWKSNFIVSKISDPKWWEFAWIRVDLIGSYYVTNYGEFKQAKLKRPIRTDGKPLGIYTSIVQFMESHEDTFVLERGKINHVCWNLLLNGPAKDKYTCIFRKANVEGSQRSVRKLSSLAFHNQEV